MPIILTDLKERAIDALYKEKLKNAQPGDKTEKPDAANGNDDPLFVEVRNALASMAGSPADLTHENGRFPSQKAAGELTADEARLTAVYGILVRDNETNPKSERFIHAISDALAEYTNGQKKTENQIEKQWDKIFGVLCKAGEAPDKASAEVQAKSWVAVARTLRGKVKSAAHLDEMTLKVFADLLTADGGLTPSAIAIDLPDLEDTGTAVEIIPANLDALQVIYFAAMLEELKMFQVVDKLLEFFDSGMLPLGQGDAGDILYGYWRNADKRLTEIERRNLYARCFGFPGGDPRALPNREFNDLWLRFLSAVSSFVRQSQVDQLLRARVAASVSQEQVRKSGRDLAANLSLHGYGIAFFAATELQAQIKEIKALLNDAELKATYGARDMFQVIDQVATLELGGARNSIRYRTMAHAGAVIIRWLAKRAGDLASSSLKQVLNRVEIEKELTSPTKPILDPTDYDLVNACEQWLAVTGTPDLRVEEYAQPSEPPMMTSRPIQIPSAARDILDEIGIPVAATAGMNGGRRGGSGYGHR